MGHVTTDKSRKEYFVKGADNPSVAGPFSLEEAYDDAASRNAGDGSEIYILKVVNVGNFDLNWQLPPHDALVTDAAGGVVSE